MSCCPLTLTCDGHHGLRNYVRLVCDVEYIDEYKSRAVGASPTSMTVAPQVRCIGIRANMKHM